MRILLSKPDALGDQLIAAGIVQALLSCQPSTQLVWHVRAGNEAIASLLGADVFNPDRGRSPQSEAERLAAVTSRLVLLTYPLSPFEEWTDDLRRRLRWWAEFLKATAWDASVLGLVNRNWVGDFTVALAPASTRIGFRANASRQPLVNDARALAGVDAPVFTRELTPSYTRAEAEQIRALFAALEPALAEPGCDLVWHPSRQWRPSSGDPQNREILIAPGVGGDPRRAWGAANFLQVAERLSARGLRVRWIEGPGDAQYLQGVPEGAAHPRGKFGPTELSELTEALAEAPLLVCQDTAYVHLAAAVGVPTVAIYGAGQGSRFHPAHGRIKIVQSRIACAGCQWHCLFDRLLCVAEIPVDVVALAIEQALAGDFKPTAIQIETPLSGDGEELLQIRRRLQEEVLMLNADRFARLQIIQSLLAPAQPDPAPPSATTASTQPHLSVIIPMGRPDRVASTLSSLAGQQQTPANWEIVLVGVEAARVARSHPHLPIEAVILPSNQLPPRTRCLGVKQARGDWLLFLDDDVELEPECLARFLDLATSDAATATTPPIGAVGLRLPGKSGRFFERLTDISNFWAQQHDTAEDRDWLYSAAIFVRAEAYRAAGGFNPDLPNGEDVDLTRRIAAAGYRLRYEPKLVARHDHRRDTLFTMWRYFWRNGNAAQYFFAATGGTWPFSVKTAWLKSWSDLRMNRAYQRARHVRLGVRWAFVWLNYLIVESSLEWHWQEHLWRSRRYRELPASSTGDRTAARAFEAFEAGHKFRGAALYALATLQNFTDPVRR